MLQIPLKQRENIVNYLKEPRILQKKINYVCEIASNDGTLLNEYKNDGYEILGVDPAKNISNKANKNNIKH